AALALMLAAIALMAPWALMMIPGVAWSAAGALGVFAIIRARQAARVLRYQRNMRRLPRYRLRADQIPVSTHKLFLGLGFRWTQTHTQRLRDTLRPEVQKYIQRPARYRWARRKEIAWESSWGLSLIARALRSSHWSNPFRAQPAVGGKPQIHAVEPEEESVWMDIGERVGHTLVLGTTRVGKTRLAEMLITQDIRRGDVVIVFDPKGDGDLLRRMFAEARRAGRENDFFLFHLGFPELSARYNAIGNFSRITEVATRIANQLPSEGNSAAFKEFAWRFVNIIARALVALGRRPDYHQVRRHINDIEPLFLEYARHHLQTQGPEDWRKSVNTLAQGINERNIEMAFRGRSHDAVAMAQYLRSLEIDDPVLEGLVSAFKYDRTYFDKIVSSVGPLMEKLTTGKVAELISPDYLDLQDTRPIFEWMKVIRRQAIVYVGLDALSDTTVAGAVGNSMFADLVSVAGHIYKHGTTQGLPDLGGASTPMPVISVHADEFNELIGDEFVPLLNKAGGAGFQVTAYTQTWSDVEARLNSHAKAGQVAGNFNTLIMLRVKEFATAEMLTRQLPQVEISSLMQVSGVNDSSSPGSGVDFTSRNEDRISVSEVPLIEPGTAMALPKGQAFALLTGGQLWKLRLPLPDARRDAQMPKDISSIAGALDRRYRSSEQWYRDSGPWWAPVRHGQAPPEDPAP
ncbi:MAG: type IV conjugative transfer system coupling protein TraD, partial [bacterium]|nr:type IV conjugative transfer system coupling protein TraD [bacterium]